MNGISPLEVRLSVYRRLDNRAEGLLDDSPRALELHNLRKDALHQALDGIAAWRVRDWGGTDDAGPHELVEIVLAVVSSPQLQAAAIAAGTWVGLEVARAGLSTIVSETVKALLAQLVPKQREEKILEFTIQFPDGTIIRCDPSSKVTIVR